MRVSGFTVPVTFDRFTLLAGLLLIVALAIVASGIVALFRERRLRLFRISGGLLLVLIGLVVFAIAGWAQTYRQLTHNEWVANIQAVPVAGQNQTMLVTYTPVRNGQLGTPTTYTIKGDEWVLGGDVIKWQDWLNVLGVDTGYRTTRIMGYYLDANDYATKPLTAYNLDGGADTLQNFLRDHANLVPFVRATYGNDVRMLPDPSAVYQVYVSTSGYWTARQ